MTIQNTGYGENFFEGTFMYLIKLKRYCKSASPQGLTQDLTIPTLMHVNNISASASALPEYQMSEE